MKKLCLLAIVALLTTSAAFSQELKKKVEAEIDRTGKRAEKFDEMIKNIENRVSDYQNGIEYNRIRTKLEEVDNQIVLLYNHLMIPVGPNMSYPPVQTRTKPLTPDEAKDVETQIKAKVDEYNKLRQELQQFNSKI
jgi:peptidoglycan hydrolase CwlO-like protein